MLLDDELDCCGLVWMDEKILACGNQNNMVTKLNRKHAGSTWPKHGSAFICYKNKCGNALPSPSLDS